MTIGELLECIEGAELSGLERFYCVIPRRCTGRLAMAVAPGLLGEVCCENSDGRTVVLVRCDDARRWLKRNHLPQARMVAFGLPRLCMWHALRHGSERRSPIRWRVTHEIVNGEDLAEARREDLA